MTIEVSAFDAVPDFARGRVKDVRVRWALEEAGLPYASSLVDRTTKDGAAYRAWQPFGQVPAFREGKLELFESGAIVLHIARTSEALAPADADGQARVAVWVLAALNTLEPFVASVSFASLLFGDEPWVEAYRARMMPLLTSRLDALTAWLGDKDFLEDRFTAGDLIMATVLRDMRDQDIAAYPKLVAYRERCLARPAFARALQSHLAVFDSQHAA